MRYLVQLLRLFSFVWLLHGSPGFARIEFLGASSFLLSQSAISQAEASPGQDSQPTWEPGIAADALFQQGIAEYRVGEFQKALDSWQAALVIYRELGDRAGEANTLGNIGKAYQRQGSYAEALSFYQQSLIISHDIGERTTEAHTLSNIGNVYDLQGNYPEALDSYRQSLAITRDIGDRFIDEANTLNKIGLIYRLQGNYGESLDSYQQSLGITRNLGDRVTEADTLGSIASIYQLQGNYDEALNFYQHSLVINRDLRDRTREANTLGDIGNLFELQDQSSLAIIFLKQAVNTYASIRDSNQALSQELKEAYALAVRIDCGDLADLLLQQNRNQEAQQAIDLLKGQELDGYLQGVHGTEPPLSMLRAEQAIIAKYDELTTTAITLAQELANLRDIEEDLRSVAQKQRIIALIDLQSDINQQFRDFSTSPEVRALLNE